MSEFDGSILFILGVFGLIAGGCHAILTLPLENFTLPAIGYSIIGGLVGVAMGCLLNVLSAMLENGGSPPKKEAMK